MGKTSTALLTLVRLTSVVVKINTKFYGKYVRIIEKPLILPYQYSLPTAKKMIITFLVIKPTL